MPKLIKLQELLSSEPLVTASNDADPCVGDAATHLRKRLKAAQAIVKALEDEDQMECTAIQLAWAQVLDHLLHGEDLKEAISNIQKLAASGRARRRRKTATSKAVMRPLSAEAMAKIEAALKLM